MKTKVEIFCDFECKPNSLVFFREIEFDSKKQIEDYANRVMDELEKIYEQKIVMRTHIKIEPYHIGRNEQQ